QQFLPVGAHVQRLSAEREFRIEFVQHVCVSPYEALHAPHAGWRRERLFSMTAMVGVGRNRQSGE
ncbi:hypothetical protein LAN31_24220, partial [Mycobacterium tuberculosis]|nr:hypothetical protein [Mycobacterium tuberculosis]